MMNTHIKQKELNFSALLLCPAFDHGHYDDDNDDGHTEIQI